MDRADVIFVLNPPSEFLLGLPSGAPETNRVEFAVSSLRKLLAGHWTDVRRADGLLGRLSSGKNQSEDFAVSFRVTKNLVSAPSSPYI